MSKPVISVVVYQIGDIVHNPPITVGVPINSKTVIVPVPHPAPAWDAMVGLNGEKVATEVAPYVYACINVNTSSNAGTQAYFTSSTVAALISDINS